MFFNYKTLACYVFQHAGTTLIPQDVCIACYIWGAGVFRHVQCTCAHVHSRTRKTPRLLGVSVMVRFADPCWRCRSQIEEKEAEEREIRERRDGIERKR